MECVSKVGNSKGVQVLEPIVENGVVSDTGVCVPQVLEGILTWDTVAEAAQRLSLTVEQVQASLAYAITKVRETQDA